MNPPGRPKGEFRSAQHEGTPVKWARPSCRPARGFALVSAIFLLVVLAMLGGVIVSLSTTQNIGQTRDLLGTRAYFAAKAALEWGSQQVLRASNCPASMAGAADGFSLVVACTAYGPYDEAGTSVMVYEITATASRGTAGAHDFAERQLRAIVSVP